MEEGLALKDIIIPIVAIVVSVILAYYTAGFQIRRERKKGKLLLLNICRRFFLNAYQAFDRNTQEIKTDSLSKKLYIEELKSILEDLSSLSTNPYFSDIVKKRPIAKTMVVLRRELIEDQETAKFALNPGSILEMWHLHRDVRKEVPKKSIKSDFEKEIVEISNILKKIVLSSRLTRA